MSEYRYYGNTNVQSIEGGEVRNYGNMTVRNTEGTILHNYGSLQVYKSDHEEVQERDEKIADLNGQLVALRNQLAKEQEMRRVLANDNKRLKAYVDGLSKQEQQPKGKWHDKDIADMRDKIDILLAANRDAAERIKELERATQTMQQERTDWDVRPSKKECEEVVRTLGIFLENDDMEQ